MLLEYTIIGVFAFVIILVTLLIPVLSFAVVQQESYQEKESAYECGFQPFENTFAEFDVRYYVVAILFLIFDLELVFVLPWLLVLPQLTGWALGAMFVFLGVLTVGFYYEWKAQGLEWD